jgi:heme exporter protein B
MLAGNEILQLIKKDFITEFRLKYAFNGILIYLASTIFIAYLSFKVKVGALNSPTWNALFWIILLFTAVNAIAKSFVQENTGRSLYLYSVVNPQSIILAKMIYNSILMFVLGFSGYFFYSLILGNPVGDQSLFLLNLLLGGLGFASTLTLVSGIASKTSQSATLMAILSFPIIIPVMLMVIKVSMNAIDGLDRSVSQDEMITLLSINVMIATLSYLLFPFLWKS